VLPCLARELADAVAAHLAEPEGAPDRPGPGEELAPAGSRRAARPAKNRYPPPGLAS
jgi:hypothetical protein